MPPVLFRKWAGAAPAKKKPNGAGPAPYGLDFEEGQDEALGSTVHNSYLDFNEESTRRMREEIAAGVVPKDGRTAAQATTRSDWGSPDWQCLTTNYSGSCNEKAIARYHRRQIQSKQMCQQKREERWVKCFRRWEKNDANTVTGTEFSILPAGWHMDGRPLPVGLPPKPQAAAEILAQAKAAAAQRSAEAAQMGPMVAKVLKEGQPEVEQMLTTRAPTPCTPCTPGPSARSCTPDEFGELDRRLDRDHGLVEPLELIRGSMRPLRPLAEPLTRSNFKKAGELRYAASSSCSTVSSRGSMVRRIHGWGRPRAGARSDDFSGLGP